MAELGKVLRFEIGFVDDSDIPPIDTWFYVTKKYLYCWIPTLFLDKMQDAIDVEILNSYEWLEKVDPALNIEMEKKITCFSK